MSKNQEALMPEASSRREEVLLLGVARAEAARRVSKDEKVPLRAASSEKGAAEPKLDAAGEDRLSCEAARRLLVRRPPRRDARMGLRPDRDEDRDDDRAEPTGDERIGLVLIFMADDFVEGARGLSMARGEEEVDSGDGLASKMLATDVRLTLALVSVKGDFLSIPPTAGAEPSVPLDRLADR